MDAPSRSLRAYTTVELLVVCGIASLLAAVLIPVGATVQQSGKLKDDFTNIGQLARCAAIYAVDADGTYMAVGAPTLDFSWSPARNPHVDASGKPWQGWGLKLAPYVRSYDAFRSPLYPKAMSFAGPCGHASGFAMTNDYAYNWMLGSDGTYVRSGDRRDPYSWSPDGTRRFDHPAQASSIVAPSDTVTFMLSGALSPTGSELQCLGVTVQASDFTNELGRASLSDNGTNVACADSHARYIADPRLAPGKGTLYHLADRKIWMEPTMPDTSMGFRNSDADNRD